jgi:hypothetical protein
VTLGEVEDLILWWSKHEGQFPTIAYLTRAILGKPGSQIETKRVFSIAGILASLHCCRLGSNNLDLLVLLIRNWHDNPTIGFEAKKGSQDVNEFGEAEEEILDLLDAEFLDEVEGHVEECRIGTCIHDFGSVLFILHMELFLF